MRKNKFEILLGHFSMLLFSFLVSISFILGALVANDIDPVAITGARFILATFIILIIVFFSKNISFSKNWPLFKKPKNYILLSICISLYFITMFEGLKTAKPISMSAVFTLTPLITALFAHFLGYQPLKKKVLLAVIIGALGSVWIIFDGRVDNFTSLKIGRGEMIFFLGCIGHALYAVFIPILNRGESSVIQTSGVLIFSSLIVFIFGAEKMIQVNWLFLPSIIIMTIVYLALFATAATFFLIQFSAKKITGTKVMSYTYAIPFWVAIASGILMGSWPSPQIILGGVLIAVALFVLLQDDFEKS